MQSTDVILEQLQEHIQLLIKRCSELKDKNNSLLTSVKEAEVKLEKAAEENSALRQKLSVTAWNNGALTDDEKKLFAKNIDTFVKEIDRCLALLRITEQP